MTEILFDEGISGEDQQAEQEDQQAEQFEDAVEDPHERALEQEFHNAAMQIFIQRNDFLLPNLIDMFENRQTLEIAPSYQRRARWDNVRKSRLVESFLVNIPVPPVFLYENDFAKYEVMDGQQRVSAILEYFDNRFALNGLQILNSLRGKRFHQLPREVKAGLERRSLPAIILLKESAPSHESAIQLRRYVFERLNTGGIRLNAQEVRNAVYTGPFNDLLIELSRHPLFTTIWDIPAAGEDGDSSISAELLENNIYIQMRDVELVLRVFGLMDPDTIRGGMRNTLDNTMLKYKRASQSDLNVLRLKFLDTLELMHSLGGNKAIRLPTAASAAGRPSASLYDAVMVALMRKLDRTESIRSSACEISRSLRAELANPQFHELVSGRANTREATIRRSIHIEHLIESVIAS